MDTPSRLPSISIIIPVYNVAAYVKECIQSVMEQTYIGPMECLVVDDCGQDNSIKICERLIAEYKGPIEFKILHHEKNKGLSCARNTGIIASKGDFVSFIDSDDFVDKKMMEDLVLQMQDTKADIVTSAITSYKDGKCTQFNWAQSGYEIFKELTFREYFGAVLNEQLDNASWNKLYRREILTQRFKEGRNNEDFLFFYYLTTEHPYARMAVTNKSYYFYRQREGSICHEKAGGVRKLNVDIIRNYTEILEDGKLPREETLKVLKSYHSCLLDVMHNLICRPDAKEHLSKEDYTWLRNEFCSMRETALVNRRRKYYAMKHVPILWRWYNKLRTCLAK